MNRMPSFEDHLNDWLEDGPTDAPDRVLDTVLAAFPSIPQRRVAWRGPWRLPPMNGYIRATAAIAAAVGVLVLGFTLVRLPSVDVGGASPLSSAPATAVTSTPSPAPSPSPLVSPSPVAIDTSGWKTYISTRYGASLRHPADWAVSPATATWPAGMSAVKLSDKMVDTLTSPGGPSLQLVSQRLAAGMTAAAWLASYEASGPAAYPGDSSAACWPAPDKMDRAIMGGQPAWVHSGCGFDEAVSFFAGRVYILTLWSEPYYNYRLFMTLLSTVAFEPMKAG